MQSKITCKGYTIPLNRPIIMGILNVTPDSFSDGGKFFDANKAIAQAKRMVAEGADIIDIGGESTKPGSEPVPKEEELRRVLPVIEALLSEVHIPISIDTMKPEVADTCLQKGVHMLNDVTGLRDPEMIKVAAKHDVPVTIMHMQGSPKTMQENIQYTNLIEDIKKYLKEQAEKAKAAGIRQIFIDPGVGFGKTVEHNFSIIKHLAEFKELGYPILIGPSRKSFIGKTLNAEPDQRIEGTLAAVTACILNGANIIRVHDVKECMRAAKIAEKIKSAQ